MGELKECGWKKADEKKEAEVGETELENGGKKGDSGCKISTTSMVLLGKTSVQKNVFFRPKPYPPP